MKIPAFGGAFFYVLHRLAVDQAHQVAPAMASHSHGTLSVVAISTTPIAIPARRAFAFACGVMYRQRGSKGMGDSQQEKAGMASQSEGSPGRIDLLLFSVDERDQSSRDDRTLPGKDCGWCRCCSAVAVAFVRDARLRPYAVGLHPSPVQLLSSAGWS